MGHVNIRMEYEGERGMLILEWCIKESEACKY